jgi:hypothetical protein
MPAIKIITRANDRATGRCSRLLLEMVSLTHLLNAYSVVFFNAHPDGLLAALIRRAGSRIRCLPFMTRPI